MTLRLKFTNFLQRFSQFKIFRNADATVWFILSAIQMLKGTRHETLKLLKLVGRHLRVWIASRTCVKTLQQLRYGRTLTQLLKQGSKGQTYFGHIRRTPLFTIDIDWNEALDGIRKVFRVQVCERSLNNNLGR